MATKNKKVPIMDEKKYWMMAGAMLGAFFGLIFGILLEPFGIDYASSQITYLSKETGMLVPPTFYEWAILVIELFVTMLIGVVIIIAAVGWIGEKIRNWKNGEIMSKNKKTFDLVADMRNPITGIILAAVILTIVAQLLGSLGLKVEIFAQFFLGLMILVAGKEIGIRKI